MNRTQVQMVVIVLLLGVLGQLYPSIKPAFHVGTISCVGLAIFLQLLRPSVAEAMAPRALACVVGLPLLAWTMPNIWLFYALLLLWVPLIAGRAGQVVPIYLFSLLLLPGLDEVAALGSIKLFDFGVHDALALGAAAMLFVNVGKARARVASDLPALAAMLLLMVALSRDTTPTHFVRMAINVGFDLGLPYYIVSRGVRAVEEMRTAMLWLGCGAIVLSAILLYEVWKAWPIYNILYDQYGLTTQLLVKARGGVLRSGGPFVEPTSAAMVLGICIIALGLSREFFRGRWSYAAIMAVALVGMTAPQSRGAWIGLLTAAAAVQLYRGRHLRLAVAGFVLGSIGSLLLLAARFSPYLSETLGLTGGSSETSEYRRLLWARGMEEFWHSPIFGFSMPQITARLSDLRQGEGIVDFVNSYIWILLIAGAVGAVLFFGAFVYYLARLLPLRRSFAGDTDGLAAASFVFAGLAMPLEMLFFTSFGGRPAFFVFALFGFAAALLAIAGERRRATAPVLAMAG